MRVLGTREEEEYLRELVRSRGDEAPTIEIQIGEQVYASKTGEAASGRDRFEEGEWGAQDGDSPALDVDIQLAGRVPFDTQNAPMTIDVIFGGLRITDITAVMSRPRYDQFNTAGTKIEALSPGGYLDKVTLNAFTEYSQSRPELAIYDALSHVSAYNPYEFDIVQFGSPLFTRLGDDGFHEEDHPSSVLSAVLESVDGVAIDNSRAGITVKQNPHVGLSSPIAWRYEANELLDWTFPSLSGPDELYTEVAVVSEDTGQPESSRIFEKAKVDWSGVKYPPIANQRLYITTSDHGAGAESRALNLAMRVARQLSAGTYKSEIVAPYNPFLEKWDTITISETFWDDLGTWHREWLAVIDGYCRTRGRKDAGLETAFSCTLTLTAADRVPGPTDVLPGVAQGVRAHALKRPVIKIGPGLKGGPGHKIGALPS